LISIFGVILMSVSLAATILAGVCLPWGIIKKEERILTTGKRLLNIGSILLLLALMLLVIALVGDQFQVKAVVKYSSRDLPFYLKLTALWAGQEGSLLLWAFLQTAFAGMIATRVRVKEKPLDGWAAVILVFIAAFFIAMTLFFSNPFQTVFPTTMDGQGMNPLLRHPGMVFHPPVLYIGYVGLSIPFAYAISALLTGRVNDWIKPVRRWLLISWIALGLGIFLGARWAYDVLGWGGYWGWDAVENAGLMPWLTATALLHGLTMQARGKGFKVWNVTLAVLSFSLVLFGTFTTRSGLIESVHAFSISELGPYFLGMIGLVLLGSLTLMVVRRNQFGELTYPEKVLSREGAFFFTLLLLMLITLSILLGTLLPTLTNGRFSAPPAWFNQVVGPQLGALVLLMGVCPLLGKWVGKKRTFAVIIIPIAGAVLMVGAALKMGFTQPGAMIGLAVAGFAGGTALTEIGTSVKPLFRKNESKRSVKWQGLGAHLVHLGVVLMAVGVIGTQSYVTEQTLTLSPGDRVQVGEYELLYEDLFREETGDHLDTWVSIPVYQGSDYLTTLSPKIVYYPAYQQSIAEPVVRAGWAEDLYLVMFRWGPSGQVSLAVTINPLSSFLWLGGFILLIGGSLAWWPRPAEKRQRKRIWNHLAAGMVFLLILLIFGVLWSGTLGLGRKTGRPLPGAAAPTFSGITIAGNDFSFSENTGEVVVVHFWATWCDQCEEEMSALEAVWQEYRPMNVQFVGIAMEDRLSDVAEMANDLQITFPLIVEDGKTISNLYGVTAVPETFILNQDGTVAYFHIGAVDSTQLEAELESLLAP
jgi:cytochrome c-type biogenesis protein CcmF